MLEKNNLRDFDKIPKEEISNVVGDTVPAVIEWMERNKIGTGSTGKYNLYTTVQEAIHREWIRSQGVLSKKTRESSPLLDKAERISASILPSACECGDSDYCRFCDLSNQIYEALVEAIEDSKASA